MNCRSATPGSSTLTCSWSRASSGVASATTQHVQFASTPSVTVQGAFTTGGNGIGTLRDHQDVFMLQNYGTATAGPHTMRFGARARAYRDADYSTAGANGSYFFRQRRGLPGRHAPSQYSATVIENPLARVLLFDGSLFVQDDWHVSRSFLLGLGLRYEAQNHIHDHDDWAPRIAFAWTPGHPGKTPAKTVIRGGYGWFFNRFIMSTAFTSGVEPYIITAMHDNRHQSAELHHRQSQVSTTPMPLSRLLSSLRPAHPFPLSTPSIRTFTPRSTCRPASASTARSQSTSPATSPTSTRRACINT